MRVAVRASAAGGRAAASFAQCGGQRHSAVARRWGRGRRVHGFLRGTAIVGYLTSAFLGWLGLARRGLTASAWILLLTPVYWLLLSLAAWRALSAYCRALCLG